MVNEASERSEEMAIPVKNYIRYETEPLVMKLETQLPRVEYIISSKTEVAQRRTNEFLAMLEEKKWELVDVKPMMGFSGPALMIGAMVLYFTKKEVTDETTNVEDERV